MKRLLAILLIMGCITNSMGPAVSNGMKLTSPSFSNNAVMPSKYACSKYGGQDINPELNISGIPEGTQSLVLIMDDPDAPAGTWVHWVVYNIPSSTESITEDSVPGTQGVNSWGNNEYGGPCPPNGTHKYFFKLYALDTTLELTNADKAEVEAAMQGHIIAQAQLIGLFQ